MFVVALLGPEYPKRIWTKFESEQFKERFSRGEVIPIWFDDAPPTMFDETSQHGGFMLQRKLDLGVQIDEIAEMLCKKLREIRTEQARISQG